MFVYFATSKTELTVSTLAAKLVTNALFSFSSYKNAPVPTPNLPTVLVANSKLPKVTLDSITARPVEFSTPILVPLVIAMFVSKPRYTVGYIVALIGIKFDVLNVKLLVATTTLALPKYLALLANKLALVTSVFAITILPKYSTTILVVLYTVFGCHGTTLAFNLDALGVLLDHAGKL